MTAEKIQRKECTITEADAGLWVVYHHQGTDWRELGAVFDQGAKMAGTPAKAYQALDGWTGATGGKLIRECATWNEAVAMVIAEANGELAPAFSPVIRFM